MPRLIGCNISGAALALALSLTLSPSPLSAQSNLSAHAAGPAPLRGPSGPLQPPVAALQPVAVSGGGSRAFGLAVPSRPRLAPRFTAAAGAVTLPQSVDLSRYDPPVGNQGSVNSCASWVTSYDLRGWYAKRDGYYPAGGPDGAGSFAPMYLYSQITNGQNASTSFDANLSLEQQQGVDTRANYTQGDDNYATLPTPAERAVAAAYRISGWSTLFVGSGQGAAAQQAIEQSLAGGNPVGLGIPVYNNFYNASSSAYYVDVPTASMTYYGNHGVFATKYDANGLWVQNQWGTGWGLNGWVELSWNFVNQYAWQAVVMSAATPPSTSTPTAIPTGTPSSTPTAIPTGTPSSTPTTIPTTTPTTALPTTTPTTAPTGTPTAGPTSVSTAIPTSTPAPAASIVVNPIGATFGQTMTVTGAGFTPGAAVSIYWDYIGTPALMASTAAVGSSFAAQVSAPQSISGTHTIIAVDAVSHRAASATVQVKPLLVLSPYLGLGGTTSRIMGFGFGAQEQVRIYWDSPLQLLGTATSNGQGSFYGTTALSSTVPLSVSPGLHWVYAVGVSSHAATAGLFYVP